jgi:membrane associated rhomboid family serine protease
MPNISVTTVLLALNVAIFGLMLAWGVDPMQPSIDSLIQWGANYGPRTTQGEWWRMFTCMFLHIGVLHLLFNMIALWNVGGFMERLLGHTEFLVLYLLAGLLGSVASVAWNPFVVSAGASGAIFGLFGGLLAFLVRHRDRQQYAFLAALRTNTLAFLGYNLVYGFLVQGIDMAAHLGGLAGGFACGFVLMPSFTLASHLRLRRRGVLVGAVGLVVIIGLSDLLPRAEDVEARLQQFASLNTATLATFNRAITQLQQDKITEAEMVRILEQEVLSPWGTQREALQQLLTLSRLPTRQKQLVLRLVEYMTARQEGWELLREGLRQHDPRALKSANDKQRQADQVLGQAGAAGKRKSEQP